MRNVLTASILAGFVALCTTSVAESRQVELNAWIDTHLVPYASRELSQHPRFRNQTVQVVVLRDESVQSATSELALTVRNRFRDALNTVPGIRILWTAGQNGAAISGTPNCAGLQPDYLVGIELSEQRRGNVTITVRALDLADRSWVPGFGASWEGTLNPAELRRYRTRTVDADFRGQRGAPWHDSELDLMAAQLAGSVGCRLLGQVGAEYILTRGNGEEEAPGQLVELVGNNLAGNTYLQFAGDDVEANAVIAGKAHRIDDDLYQYWITITPLDTESGLVPVSADAYVRIRDPHLAAMLIPEQAYELAPGMQPFLERLSVIALPERSSCSTPSSRLRTTNQDFGFSAGSDSGCYALQLRSDEDAVVFFLNHQLNNGLVRLASDDCSFRTDGRIARRNGTLRFHLPIDALSSGNWSTANRWSLAPRQETYFAIASRNTRAARALSAHIATLPKKCSASIRPGLEGPELRHWLDELQQILQHWESDIDWRGIRIKEIY